MVSQNLPLENRLIGVFTEVFFIFCFMLLFFFKMGYDYYK